MMDIDDSRAPLLEHLIELRQRLLWCVGALLASFALCFYFADEIFGFLVRPLTEAFGEGKGRLVYTKLYEAFFVEVKVALFAAFFLRSEEHTSELQSLMRISYAAFCLKKKNKHK